MVGIAQALAYAPDLPNRWKQREEVIEVPRVDWKSGLRLATMARMTKLQLQRMGRGRNPGRPVGALGPDPRSAAHPPAEPCLSRSAAHPWQGLKVPCLLRDRVIGADQQSWRKRVTMVSSTSAGSRFHQFSAEKISTSQRPR